MHRKQVRAEHVILLQSGALPVHRSTLAWASLRCWYLCHAPCKLVVPRAENWRCLLPCTLSVWRMMVSGLLQSLLWWRSSHAPQACRDPAMSGTRPCSMWAPSPPTTAQGMLMLASWRAEKAALTRWCQCQALAVLSTRVRIRLRAMLLVILPAVGSHPPASQHFCSHGLAGQAPDTHEAQFQTACPTPARSRWLPDRA